MIQNYFDDVKRILGSLISNARAREGWGKGIYLFSFLKIGGSPAKRARRAGKMEGGLGEGIFARLLSAEGGMGRESVSAIPASAGRRNRKIFVSLIEKNFGGAQLKNVKKIFLFCSPSGERKRWAGFLPVRAEIVARKRFALRSVIATRRNLTDFAESLFARSPRLRRGFARIFPHISAQNQRAFENQKSVFCPAGGGSACEAHDKMKILFPIFPFSPKAKYEAIFCFPRFRPKATL